MDTTTEEVAVDALHHPIIHRYVNNPILTYKDVPYHAALVFNAGVTKLNNRYVMVFRNDFGDFTAQKLTGTNLGFAASKDGVHWHVLPDPCFTHAAQLYHQLSQKDDFIRAYDPRLTVIEGRCYMTFALDTKHGVLGGIAVTDNFEDWELLSITSPDNRNLALFPERINDQFVRLERPMPMYSRGWQERFDLWISESPDLIYWGNPNLLLAVENVPYANRKIGPAAPPVKTKKGWLATFHAVDFDPARGKNGWEAKWRKRYTAGLMLLDLENPRKVIGMSPQPILKPEAVYEVSGGFRNNVIFPGGMILEDSGEVKFYYGAADTVMCLATADVSDLLAICKPLV